MSFSAIVLRREIINSKGKRQSSGWQRCYMQLQGDLLRIRNAGGILLDNTDELDELEATVEPIDSINLRLIHVQKIPDQNCLCLHFTKGMERILLCPEAPDEGRTIDTWANLFQRSVRDSVLLDQYHTSIFLHTYKCDDILSYVHKSSVGIFDESFPIECKWLGMIEFQRCTFSVKMKPGWNDCRVVSKRCITISKDDGTKKTVLASINPVTSFHLLSETEGIVIIEGDGRYQLNNSKIVPIAERIPIRLLQNDDLKRFMIFLRDAFEIILPRPTLFDDSTIDGSSGFKKITVDDKDAKQSESESISELVQSQPWNQLAWNDLYSYYKLKNFKNFLLDPYNFTVKFKSFGFCLKSAEGLVISSQQIKRIAENSENDDQLMQNFTSMYWHHLALKHTN